MDCYCKSTPASRMRSSCGCGVLPRTTGRSRWNGCCGYSFLTDGQTRHGGRAWHDCSAHVAGETITIYNRLAWSSGGSNIYTNFGTASTQVAEFVTASAHGLKAGQNIMVNGSLAGVLTHIRINTGNLI